MNKYYIYYHRDPRPEFYGWKRYIGKGSKNRANNLGNRYGIHKNWIKSLKTLGLKPIIEIIEYFKEENEAYEKEIFLIKKYTELNYILYNGTVGGDGVRLLDPSKHCWNGKKHTLETKIKISKSKIGKKHTLETKIKMSKSKIGIKISDTSKLYGNKRALGSKRTEEERKAMSKRLIGNKYNVRPIICVNNGVIYSSVRDAVNKLNLDERSVFRVLKGEYKHTKGYVFKYY